MYTNWTENLIRQSHQDISACQAAACGKNESRPATPVTVLLGYLFA